MREKDIKKLFDICAGSGEINNNSEEIKSAVMKKIGISNAEGFYTDDKGEEAVSPVFVTAPKKNKSRAAIRIAAVGAAAAACFGVTALCMGMFDEGGILSSLTNNAENNKNVPTETAAFTDVSDGQNINSEAPGEDKSMQLVFLDGVCFTYNPSDENPYCFSETNMEKTIPFLYEKNGRLYIENTRDGGKETAEDITDKISSDDFYIYRYNNPANIVKPTHYVIIGGDVSTGDYGYVEIYKINNSTNYWGWEANFSDNSFDFPRYDLDNSGKEWIANGVKELAKFYGVAANVIGDGIGCYDINVDFKYRVDIKYGHEIMQITLLDGCQFNLNYNSPGVCFEESDVTPLLYEEDGRVYFIANKYGKEMNEDITDKIKPGDFYLYIYNNPNNPVNQTHYVVICGDLSEGNYGYWEVFQIHNDKDPLQSEWGYTGQQSKADYSEMQWFIDAQNMLKKEYGVNSFSVGNCKTNADFKAARN